MKQNLKSKASANEKTNVKMKKAPAIKAAPKKSPPLKMSKAPAPAAKPIQKPATARPSANSKTFSVPQLNNKGDVHHHDVLQMIMDDHKPLKRLIAVLKNQDLSLSARRSAFNEFAPLLTIHAKAEESTLYVHMKKQDGSMRTDGLEGEVEHFLADLMVEETKKTVDKDVWTAKAKVLAELVEHHIAEEEVEMFPEIKKKVEMLDLVRLGEEYLAEKEKVKMDVVHPPVQKREVPLSIRH